MAANSLGGLSLTAIAEESLPVFQKILPPFEAFTTDFSNDTAAAFSGISTRFPYATTSSFYTRANGYTVHDASSSAVTVTLSDTLHSVAAFTDFEVSTITMPRLINTFLKPCMYAVLNDMFKIVTSNVTIANWGSASVQSANYGWGEFFTGSIQQLKTNGVTSDKSVILNSAYYGKLLNDVKQNYVLG